MSYVLYCFEKSFYLIDRTAYKGAPFYGSEIDVKKDGKDIKGMYIDEGTLTEMSEEKDKYDRGEKKIPKRIKNPILRVVEPHESDEDLSEDEPLLEALGKLVRPVRGVRVKQERMSVEPERKKHRGNSLPPSTLPHPSTTVLPLIPPATVLARSTKKAIAVPVLPSSAAAVPSLATSPSQPVYSVSSRQDRLEREVGDITNDIVGIRHESRGLVEVTELIQKDVSTLTTVIEEVRDRLPPPPKGPQYDLYGLTEEKVSDLDDLNDGILIFAGKLDALLFESTHLPHQQRNQDKLRWLLQVVMHRRRHSIGDEAKKWRTQILQRININAKRKEEDLQLLGKSHPSQRHSNAARPPQPIPPPSSFSSAQSITVCPLQSYTPPVKLSSHQIRPTPRSQPFSSSLSSTRPTPITHLTNYLPLHFVPSIPQPHPNLSLEESDQ